MPSAVDDSTMDTDSAIDETHLNNQDHNDNNENDNDSDDEIIAEYDIYCTPPLPTSQVLLFQYPNRDRDQPYNTSDESPSELRIKPQNGFVEMDILQSGGALTMDFEKAERWREVLEGARERKVDFYGVATGFGKGIKVGDGAGAGAGQTLQSERESKKKSGGSGLGSLTTGGSRQENIQTLGGLIVRPEPGQPLYMQGVFRGTEVHLTPLAGYVQMRPQFHHLDAEARQEALAASRYNTTSAGKEERITMSMQVARSAGETEEEVSAQKTAELLGKVAEEPWSRLKCYGEESEEAFATYEDKCFLKDEGGYKQRVLRPMVSEFGYLKSVAVVEGSKSRSLGPSGRGV